MIQEEVDSPDGHTHRQVLFQPELVVRESTAGFAGLSVAALDPSSKLTLGVAMLVGGGVGSTAGGLKLLQGNLGRSVIKVSAVPEDRHVVEAPARVFDSQEALQLAFKAGELDRMLLGLWQQLKDATPAKPARARRDAPAVPPPPAAGGDPTADEDAELDQLIARVELAMRGMEAELGLGAPPPQG